MAPCELGPAGLGADAPEPPMFELDLLSKDQILGIGLRHCATEGFDLAQIYLCRVWQADADRPGREQNASTGMGNYGHRTQRTNSNS